MLFILAVILLLLLLLFDYYYDCYCCDYRQCYYHVDDYHYYRYQYHCIVLYRVWFDLIQFGFVWFVSSATHQRRMVQYSTIQYSSIAVL